MDISVYTYFLINAPFTAKLVTFNIGKRIMPTDTKAAKVVELRPNQSTIESEKKWGKAVCKLGFSVIPSLIFKAQARLGLSSTQLVVLLQLADHWWESDRHPYPSKSTIADRLKLSPRQVQRHVEDLEKAGFVKRIEHYAAHKGRQANRYDLSGLVEKLKKLEPEFREVAEMKKQVSRRGGIRKQVITS